jgi:hypothetical protein
MPEPLDSYTATLESKQKARQRSIQWKELLALAFVILIMAELAFLIAVDLP